MKGDVLVGLECHNHNICRCWLSWGGHPVCEGRKNLGGAYYGNPNQKGLVTYANMGASSRFELNVSGRGRVGICISMRKCLAHGLNSYVKRVINGVTVFMSTAA